ncbi:MAG: hypothetical protein Q4G62_11140, partial [Pseudomonadota bacterium]|nr:hypothetical protein [Pseudomonadota bacterium]
MRHPQSTRRLQDFGYLLFASNPDRLLFFIEAGKNLRYVGAMCHSEPNAARRRVRAPRDGFTACPVGQLAAAYSDDI